VIFTCSHRVIPDMPSISAAINNFIAHPPGIIFFLIISYWP
jgi:hypothetical protein